MKKLLLDSGGLIATLEPLECLDSAGEDDRARKCSAFLSPWSCPPDQVPLSQTHVLYASLLIGCLSSLRAGSKVTLDARGPVAEEPLQEDEAAEDVCPYRASVHDLEFELDDGTVLSANREALSGGRAGAEASEYFRALLTGGFDEALQGAAGEPVHIGDVATGALLPVLHYLHGCRATVAGQQRCPVLSSLASWENPTPPGGFQESPLGEAMVGANRFLVPGLQTLAEELCVTLLDRLASTHWNPRGSSQHATLCSLLPQAYRFSQRYSYPRLSRACLSSLLRPQEARFAPLPAPVSADCLVRLAREADSTEALRWDLLGLAAAALS